jgi:acylglycerol lipase
VLYGKRAEIVPRRPLCLIVSRLPAPGSGRRWRAVLYPNGYHMLFRDLSGDLVTRDIAAWLIAKPATHSPDFTHRRSRRA